MTGPLVAPDLVPVASAPSLEAANEVKDAADSNPAINREVILMFIMVRLQR
ncbi:hypothetical protein D3C71_1996070 [compost metagenome]